MARAPHNERPDLIEPIYTMGVESWNANSACVYAVDEM